MNVNAAAHGRLERLAAHLAPEPTVSVNPTSAALPRSPDDVVICCAVRTPGFGRSTTGGGHGRTHHCHPEGLCTPGATVVHSRARGERAAGESRYRPRPMKSSHRLTYCWQFIVALKPLASLEPLGEKPHRYASFSGVLYTRPAWREGRQNAQRPRQPADAHGCGQVRTPICKAKRGAFKDTAPDVLLTAVLKAVVERSGVDPTALGDLVVRLHTPPRLIRRRAPFVLWASRERSPSCVTHTPL
jgi:hypothetical protein